MGKISNFFGEIANENIRLIEKINECIESEDNSIVDILDKDYYMLEKESNPSEGNERLRKVIKNVGFSGSLIEMGQLLVINDKLNKFNGKLSDKDLYTKVCEVGLKVLKDNFENSKDIEIFNKMYQECLYYKDEYLNIFK